MESISNKQDIGEELLLRVPYIEALQYDAGLEAVAAVLDAQPQSYIAHAPWAAFRYKPDTRFSMVHSGNCLYLKFYVEERSVVAAHATTHSPVYKDSCVEFFVSLDGIGYYNFEFNCTGTCLAAFGKDREGREFLPLEAVNRIRRHAVIDRNGEGEGARWTLTLVFPVDVFVAHKLSSFGALGCRANFYKCGDDLPEPHYLAWAPVETPGPDFHQSCYFGRLVFA